MANLIGRAARAAFVFVMMNYETAAALMYAVRRRDLND
jgi:hypothetical protein